MKAPLLIFILSAFAMAILILIRRKFLLSAIVTGLVAVGIALFAIFIPLDEALNILGQSIRFETRWMILGRSFLLDSANKASVGFLYLSGGFILAGAWTAKPVRMFFPLGIGILALIAASLMIDPFLFAAVFIELAAITASLILSSRKVGQNRGGLRLLILYTMAMLTILLVGWLLDVNQKEIELQGLSMRLALLLGFGFAVLLSIPPFHSWIPIASGENHPFAWAFISIVLQSAGLFFVVRFISGYTWLNENRIIYDALRMVGATMSLLAALWAAVQTDLIKMGSYALITDLGVMLIAIGVGTQEGLQLALGLTGARVISVACLSQGLNQLHQIGLARNQQISDKGVKLSSFAIAAIFLGMLSLAGFPLTAGFPGRWGILAIIASLDNYAWIAMMGSTAVLSIATIRCANILLSKSEASRMEVANWKESFFIGGGILLTLVLGIYPQLLFPWIVKAIEGIAY